MKSNILIFCAHSDDEAAGMGGSIVKYLKEGKEVVKVVFSFGENSHPHMREDIVVETRVRETEEAGKSFGIKEIVFLGLKDTKLLAEVEKEEVRNRIKELIKKSRPAKIFIPSGLDPHPDHRAVNKAVLSALDELGYECEVLVFDVWGYIPENKPLIYVDVTPYLKQKIFMMKQFKSQKHFMYLLLLPVYFRAIINGLRKGCRYAERFYRVR